MPALAHVLVFVYWLGGDLGAFCASYYATDPRRPVGERALALRLVQVVDTAPAVALVLTLPTGVALAISRGWLGVSWLAWAALALASLAWLATALVVHLRPGPSTARLARADSAIRLALIAGLAAGGAGGLAVRLGVPLPLPPLPLFLALKLLILAACTTLGLLLRAPLREFLAAFATLGASGPDRDVEHVLRRTMATCRRAVVGIWVLLLGAAALGLWHPA
jgi:hypothetical protein